MGIVWRFIVVFVACGFAMGFAGLDPRTLPNGGAWLGGIAVASLILANLWQHWSVKKRVNPDVSP